MKQSLTKLVDVILQKLQEQSDRPYSETGMRKWLAREGYATRDIDAAIKLARPRMQSEMPPREGAPGRLRHFSEYERFKLSPQARDALVRLELYEMIDPGEREAILERLDQFDGEVTLGDLDYLLTWAVCSTRDVESQQTIYSIIDGSGPTLH